MVKGVVLYDCSVDDPNTDALLCMQLRMMNLTVCSFPLKKETSAAPSGLLRGHVFSHRLVVNAFTRLYPSTSGDENDSVRDVSFQARAPEGATISLSPKNLNRRQGGIEPL